MLQPFEGFCSVLQRVAKCLQSVAVCCRAVQYVACVLQWQRFGSFLNPKVSLETRPCLCRDLFVEGKKCLRKLAKSYHIITTPDSSFPLHVSSWRYTRTQRALARQRKSKRQRRRQRKKGRRGETPAQTQTQMQTQTEGDTKGDPKTERERMRGNKREGESVCEKEETREEKHTNTLTRTHAHTFGADKVLSKSKMTHFSRAVAVSVCSANLREKRNVCGSMLGRRVASVSGEWHRSFENTLGFLNRALVHI